MNSICVSPSPVVPFSRSHPIGKGTRERQGCRGSFHSPYTPPGRALYPPRKGTTGNDRERLGTTKVCPARMGRPTREGRGVPTLVDDEYIDGQHSALGVCRSMTRYPSKPYRPAQVLGQTKAIKVGDRRLRGAAGVAQRRRRLRAEPLCRMCKAQGRITVATVPDHIKPLSQGGLDVDDNIQCLCDDCHRTKTAKDFGHVGRRAVGVDGWPL